MCGLSSNFNITEVSFCCFTIGRWYIPKSHSSLVCRCLIIISVLRIETCFVQDKEKFLRFQLNILFQRTIYFVYPSLIFYKNANWDYSFLSFDEVRLFRIACLFISSTWTKVQVYIKEIPFLNSIFIQLQ